MSEPKFTKGPWNHVRYEHDDYPQDDYSYIVNPERKEICVMDYCGGDDYNNADLIAAAPDMYAMLEELATCGAIANGLYTAEIKKLLARARGEK